MPRIQSSIIISKLDQLDYHLRSFLTLNSEYRQLNITHRHDSIMATGSFDPIHPYVTLPRLRFYKNRCINLANTINHLVESLPFSFRKRILMIAYKPVTYPLITNPTDIQSNSLQRILFLIPRLKDKLHNE